MTKNERMRQFVVVIPDAMREELRALAASQDVSMGHLVRRAIRQYLQLEGLRRAS